MEVKEEVDLIDAPDFAVVRNYISTFSMNKGRSYRASARGKSFIVRRVS
jgi:hypothetical protein